MKRAALIATAFAAFAITAAGCAGAGAVDSKPVRTNEVTLVKSYRFSPERITVERGTSVTWTNEDNFSHTVQVDGQPDHDLGRGESVSIRFDKPGTYHYTCTLHPHDMSGEVIVR